MSVCEQCLQGKCDGYETCDWCDERIPDDGLTVVPSRGMVLCDECYDELEGE